MKEVVVDVAVAVMVEVDVRRRKSRASRPETLFTGLSLRSTSLLLFEGERESSDSSCPRAESMIALFFLLQLVVVPVAAV